MSEEVVPLEFIARSSRRAHHYMVAYKVIANGIDIKELKELEAKGHGDRATPLKLEKIVKACKSHWCAMDTDLKFIIFEDDKDDETTEAEGDETRKSMDTDDEVY